MKTGTTGRRETEGEQHHDTSPNGPYWEQDPSQPPKSSETTHPWKLIKFQELTDSECPQLTSSPASTPMCIFISYTAEPHETCNQLSNRWWLLVSGSSSGPVSRNTCLSIFFYPWMKFAFVLSFSFILDFPPARVKSLEVQSQMVPE